MNLNTFSGVLHQSTNSYLHFVCPFEDELYLKASNRTPKAYKRAQLGIMTHCSLLKEGAFVSQRSFPI